MILLEANRTCPYGGGRKDCSCDGNCRWLKPSKHITHVTINGWVFQQVVINNHTYLIGRVGKQGDCIRG